MKIKINSPLVKINKPETTEKKIILLNFSLFINNSKNFRNNREKIICKFIDEICPQAYTFNGINEKITELINDNLFEKKF